MEKPTLPPSPSPTSSVLLSSSVWRTVFSTWFCSFSRHCMEAWRSDPSTTFSASLKTGTVGVLCRMNPGYMSVQLRTMEQGPLDEIKSWVAVWMGWPYNCRRSLDTWEDPMSMSTYDRRFLPRSEAVFPWSARSFVKTRVPDVEWGDVGSCADSLHGVCCLPFNSPDTWRVSVWPS